MLHGKVLVGNRTATFWLVNGVAGLHSQTTCHSFLKKRVIDVTREYGAFPVENSFVPKKIVLCGCWN